MKQRLPRRDKRVLTNLGHRERSKRLQHSMKQRRATLNGVLKYRNATVVDRYLKEFGGTRKEADVVFRETLKWLYLANRSHSVDLKNPVECFITTNLIIIDDMWHTFILFTRDYTDFCTRHFGQYIHHQPVTDEVTAIPEKELKRKRRRFHAYVYDTLGRTTFRRWF